MLYLYHVNTMSYHELKDTLTIGRTGGDLVFTNDNLLSGKHAQVIFENGEIYVKDLGSKNQTVADRAQLPPNRKIHIGVLSLLEIGAQLFITSETKPIPLDVSNKVMDRLLRKVIQLAEDATETGMKILRPKKVTFEDEMEAKEQEVGQLERQIAELEQKTKTELAKLDEEKEKLILNFKSKKAELSSTVLTIKSEIMNSRNERHKIRMELENKKKKIINLKDIA